VRITETRTGPGGEPRTVDAKWRRGYYVKDDVVWAWEKRVPGDGGPAWETALLEALP
jgi:hypothetical protein